MNKSFRKNKGKCFFPSTFWLLIKEIDKNSGLHCMQKPEREISSYKKSKKEVRSRSIPPPPPSDPTCLCKRGHSPLL